MRSDYTSFTCDHCKRQIHRADGGTVAVLIQSPVMADPLKHVLCGFCSFTLGEYLCPELKDSEGYQTDAIALATALTEIYGEPIPGSN